MSRMFPTDLHRKLEENRPFGPRTGPKPVEIYAVYVSRNKTRLLGNWAGWSVRPSRVSGAYAVQTNRLASPGPPCAQLEGEKPRPPALMKHGAMSHHSIGGFHRSNHADTRVPMRGNHLRHVPLPNGLALSLASLTSTVGPRLVDLVAGVGRQVGAHLASGGAQRRRRMALLSG